MNGSPPSEMNPPASMRSDATAADHTMMRLALTLAAEAAEAGEVPVGAVVYRLDAAGQPEILGQGRNIRERDADPCGHAEILALREAARQVGTWRLDGCSIAVTLEPCPMCAGALVNSRLQRLVYGAPDPKMGCVDTLYQLCTEPRFNHRLAVISGVMAEPCADVLRAFFRERRQQNRRPKPSPGSNPAPAPECPASP